jgi:hypothetical protein
MRKHFTECASAPAAPTAADGGFDITNKEFEWVVGSGFFIRFEKSNRLTTPWREGTYTWCEDKTVLATFGGFKHQVYFYGESYDTFLSVRHGDCDIVRGASARVKTLPECEYDLFYEDVQHKLRAIEEIVVKSGVPMIGNSFYLHCTLVMPSSLYSKQVNLFWYGKGAASKICEIGFNAGHSALLMLVGRNKTSLSTTFTVFDLNEHAYVKQCMKFSEDSFQNTTFEFVEGDSTQTMPAWILKNKDAIGTYDLVHVDGGHGDKCVSSDMKHADILVKVGGVIIIDDTWDEVINVYVDQYLRSGKYSEVDILKTYMYPHRIIQKIIN